MIRLVLATALTLALAGCTEPSAPTAAPEAAPAAPAEPATPVTVADPLDAAIAGTGRTPEFVERDRFRNPRETLAFFGLRPDMTVIEITPGGGWYAEILAPYLREHGRYLGAIVDEGKVEAENARAYYTRTNQALRDKFAASPELFDAGELIAYDQDAPVFGEPASADAVLTFRNVHNWMNAEGRAEGMFAGFFAALKPGGVLGVVEHRAAADVPAGDRSGYVGQAQVIALAEAAGFVLEEASEINANPADSKDHPNGVWTLPPTLRVPEGEDAEKYKAIGESDRMTLRFRKPAG